MMVYYAKAIHGLGWTMVVLGSLSIVLGVTAVATFASRGENTPFHYIGGPIWSGVFVLVTGILGVVSGKKPTIKCLIVAFMVMGILTILATLPSYGLAVSGAIDASSTDGSCRTLYNNYDFEPPYYQDIIPYNDTMEDRPDYNDTIDYSEEPQRTSELPHDYSFCTTVSTTLHGVTAFLAFTELVLGFVVSIMCCCGLCGSNPSDVVYGPGVAPAQVMSNGQGGFILLQAVPSPQQFGPHQQVFIAQQPHGGPMAPLQVYYTAGQAPPPQYSQSVGMGATAAPPQCSQQVGMEETAAPAQYGQSVGMGTTAVPPQYIQPTGMGDTAAPPQYIQPTGMGDTAALPQYIQPTGMGDTAALPQYIQPTGMGDTAARPQYCQSGGMGAAAPPQNNHQANTEATAAPPLDTKTPFTAQ